MNFGKHSKKKKFNFFHYLILSGFVIKALAFIFNRRNRKKLNINFKDFIDEEKEEVEELVNGKEGFKKFCCDSGSIFQEYFIPSESNEHKPKILRTKSLAIIVLALIIVKMSVAGYLFFICPNQARMSELISNQILELINTERKSNGGSGLSSNSELNSAALSKAQDMVDKEYFAHESPDGRMPWNFINRSEYAYLFAGENLAMNFSSAQSAHNALMLSETHKKNILNKRYSDVGLAVLTGTIDGKKTNVLVQIFGSTSSTKLAVATVESNPVVQKQTATLPPSIVKKTAPMESPQVKSEKVEPEPSYAEASEGRQKNLISEEIKDTSSQNKIQNIAPEIKPSSVLNTKKKAIPDIDFSGMREGMIGEIKSFNINQDKKISLAANVIKISHYIFFITLAIVAVSLLINIFIKFSIQHKPVIIESALVIIFIIGLSYAKTNFLEYVLERVFVV